MSLTNSVAGGLPDTGGTVGSPAAGGFGEIGAHLVGAAAVADGDGDGDVLAVGDDWALATDLLSEPPTSTTTNAISPPMTARVPITAPMIVLRRRRRARSCCSRSRRRS